MFYGMPTDPSSVNMEQDIRATYINRINSETTQDGNPWRDYIPDNGLYNFDIFVPTYISNLGLVKLYRIDYTVLESSFLIQEAEVFDNGYAVFNLKNTGSKDLFIKNVKINGEEYNFAMGDSAQTHIVSEGDSDIVWVDIKSKGTIFQEDDVVEISVTAESEALGAKRYEFSNHTSNFFVKEAEQGVIRINRENSRVIQKNQFSVDMFLEVENVGNTTEILERFYFNDDITENRINPNNIEYLSGSLILNPGDKSIVQISDGTTSFYPIRTYNKVGVATPNEAKDEVLFTSTIENYGISALGEERILSPEVFAAIESNYRNHIPVNLTETHAYTYANGSTILKINVKNTRDIIFGIDSIYLTESLTEVDFEDFYTESGSLILDPDEEDFIIVDATDYTDLVVNDEILVCVTGSFGTTVTSDIFYIHTIKDDLDLQIIENIGVNSTSFIYANETGKLLIKNTGDELVTIDEIYVNSTLVSNVTYLFGNPSLDLQECAILSFDIPLLMINQSNDMIVNVTTTTTAETSEILEAYVDSAYYDIRIDDVGTSAFDIANMTLLFTNHGLQNVTLESVYVNDTYISLPNIYANFESTWVPLTSNNIEAFNVGVGDSIELTIRIDDLESILGFAIDVNDELAIVIRVEEGAEINHIETVI
jgi:hypothetical protein